jgi:acyl-CoA dehydrogenase
MSEYAAELTDLVRSMAQITADDVDRWPEIRELGLVGIGTPEEAGGTGGTLSDLLVVIRELGLAGITSPVVEASTALYATGEGDGFGTLAFTDADLRSTTVTADLDVVAYAGTADRLVLIGTTDVATVRLANAGVHVYTGTDVAATEVGRVLLDKVDVTLLTAGPGPAVIGERLALARSAQLLGIATAAYALTRTYVAHRRQFDAPLTAIPAVSAALAQMAVRLRSVQSALDRAVEVFDDDTSAARRFAAAAGVRLLAAEAATHIARTAHQLHGAVGITLEYGLHHHTRRLWAGRDVDRSERQWSQMLGASARGADEPTLWDELTA